MSLPRPLEQMKEESRRDDWHLFFVGSDICQLIGEIECLQDGTELERLRDEVITEQVAYGSALGELSKVRHELERLRKELRRMLAWHDAVRKAEPLIPSPYHIEETRRILNNG